ncbi:MAG: hypothetical protein DRJ47_00170 [Thermoprotei archaeon]|nr:MAG: hypothetical protein DRJ47_00170 [Thermoprotei archaeon]
MNPPREARISPLKWGKCQCRNTGSFSKYLGNRAKSIKESLKKDKRFLQKVQNKIQCSLNIYHIVT